MAALDAFASAPRWVAWRGEMRHGRLTKVPHSPQRGMASVGDQTTWSTRAEAQARAAQIVNSAGGGIGIILGDLGDTTTLAGLDVDSCMGDDGKPLPWAREILEAVPTYAEVSPSGGGLKLYFRMPSENVRPFLGLIGVQLGAFGCRRSVVGETGADHGPAIEFYAANRFFAVTGNRWPDSPDEIATIDDGVLARLAALMPPARKNNPAGFEKAPPTPGDNSRSARAYRLAFGMRKAGASRDQFRAALLADTELTQWYHSKGSLYGERELARAWDLKTGDLRHSADGRQITLIRYAAMKARLDGRPLVRGLIEHEQTSVFFGAPGSGKTFLALDIGLHVAAGKEWCGRRVSGGGVVYVAAEAGRSIVNRVAAWRQDHDDVGDLPFAAITSPVDLCHSSAGDVDRLVAAIEAAKFDPVVLIIVDTVSRVLAGGNENAPDDMGALVMSLDRLRDVWGCHVMAVHHTGKDATRGARGHSLLLGAVDTEVEVNKDASGIFFATTTKQRDGPASGRIAFTLRPIVLGTDDDGEPVTSCVVGPMGNAGAVPQQGGAGMLRGDKKLALEVLRQAITEAGEPDSDGSEAMAVPEATWRERFMAAADDGSRKEEARDKAFRRARSELIGMGVVAAEAGRVRTPQSDRTLDIRTPL